MKKFFVVLLLLALGGGAWYYFKIREPGEQNGAEMPEFAAQKGGLRINVLEGGNIQALDYLQIKNQVKLIDGVKILKIIEEGYQVTEEDVKQKKVLVQLDHSSLEEKLVDHDVEFQQTESLFADARQDIEISESTAQSQLKAGRQALRFSLLDFEKYVGKKASREILTTLGLPHDNLSLGRYEEEATAIIASAFDPEKLKESIKQELKEKPFTSDKDSLSQGVNFTDFIQRNKLDEGAAEQTIRKMKDEALVAASQLSLVEQSMAGAQRLREKDFINQLTLDNEIVNFDKTKLSLQTKETELDLFLDYEFPKEAQKMLSNYEESLLDLIRNKRASMALMSKSYARYRSNKRRYELELSKRADLEAQITSCVIHAEKPGLVSYGAPDQNYYTSRYYESIAEGATVKYGQPIITIPDMSNLGVTVNIHESNIKKVSLDQRAFITAESVPDKVLEGRVSKVAVLPDSNASRFNPSLKVYPATIEIPGNNDFLKPGMSAKAEILVSELHDVVFIPVQAVFTEDAEHFVFLKKGNNYERHVVTIGQHNDQYIEIQKGLLEKNIVALAKPEDYEPALKPKETKANKVNQVTKTEPAGKAEPINQVPKAEKGKKST